MQVIVFTEMALLWRPGDALGALWVRSGCTSVY